MAFPLDTQVDIYAGAWTGISDYVFDRSGDQGLSITRGLTEGATRADPSKLSLSIDNRDGRFSPRNPLSPFYGLIGRNTPIRVHAGLGGTPTYRSVATASISGASGTCNKPAGAVEGDVLVAFHTVDRGLPVRQQPPTGGSAWHHVATTFVGDSTTKCWWKVAGPSEPSTYGFVQVDSLASGVVAISAYSGAIACQIKAVSEQSTSSDHTNTPGVTPVGTNDIELRWAATGAGAPTWTAPGGYTERADLSAGAAVSGTLATVTLAGNATTDTLAFVSSAAVTERHGMTVTVSARSVRFTGEVSSWPSRWDESDTDVWVPIEAHGVTRRLGMPGATEVTSSWRREILSPGRPNLLEYWPGEDGEDATQIASAVGGPAMTYGGTAPNFGQFTDWRASDALPTFEFDTFFIGYPRPYTNTGETLVRCFVNIPSGGVTNEPKLFWIATSGTAALWVVSIDSGGSLRLRIYDNGGTLLHDTGLIAFNMNGKLATVELRFTQNGSDIDWEWWVVKIDQAAVSTDASAITDTTAGRTLGNVTQMLIAGEGAMPSGFAAGHIMLAASDTFFSVDIGSANDALVAWAGERAGRRLQRLCSDLDVPFSFVGDLDETVQMGPMSSTDLLDLLDECAQSDGGLLYEPRHDRGLAYRTRESLYSQAPTVELTYGAQGELAYRLDPEPDDEHVINDSTVHRRFGSSGSYIKREGPLNVNDPTVDPEGVGRYPESPTLSLRFDVDAQRIAEWRVHKGTFDGERFPSISSNGASLAHAGKSARLAQLASVDIGDRIVVADPPAWMPPEDIDVLHLGVTEDIDTFLWDFEGNYMPAGPFRIGVLDDAGSDFLGFLDSDDTALLDAISSADTSVRVANVGDERAATLWTDVDGDYDWRIAGERVTVTAVSDIAASFVGAGTAVHGDNASVVPTIHGSAARWDLMLLLAAIRNTSASINTVTGGWTLIRSEFSNFQLWARIHDGSESNPTVSFTGGAAGDTTSAQIAVFRGVQMRNLRGDILTNASAQNIAIPGLSGLYRNNTMVLRMGRKSDDWTSVAGSGTEIGEPSSTSGNDQGLWWSYEFLTTAADVAASTATVTGGAAAVSQAMIGLLDCSVQSATITRAVNGISKAHSAGTQASLYDPVYLGL